MLFMSEAMELREMDLGEGRKSQEMCIYLVAASQYRYLSKNELWSNYLLVKEFGE